MASGTRARILDAAADLMRERGYAGTGLKAISTRAGAPFGSMYHFFPDGTAQLAAAALRRSADGYAERAATALIEGGDDPVVAVGFAFDRAAEVLVDTEYVDACPIATVALEVASSHDELRALTAEIFEGWRAPHAASFVAAGADAARARPLSTLFLAALEGGFLLCRSAQDPEPLRVLGRQVAAAVRAELTGASRADPPPTRDVEGPTTGPAGA